MEILSSWFSVKHIYKTPELKIGHCKGGPLLSLFTHHSVNAARVKSQVIAGAQGQNKIGNFAGSPANSRGAVLQPRPASAYAKMGEEEG
jgi:hypothetical protein